MVEHHEILTNREVSPCKGGTQSVNISFTFTYTAMGTALHSTTSNYVPYARCNY